MSSHENGDDFYWHDDLLSDAGFILTKEEYESKVVFDKNLLTILDTDNSKNPEAVWHSLTNDKDEFIQQGRPGKTSKYDIISIKHGKSVDSEIIASFGDLLIHLDTKHRVKWKQFFKYTDSPINLAKILLFPQSKKDFQLCATYWNKRRKDYNDIADLPWMTPGDHDQIQEELSYLKHIWDDELHMTKDMKILKFKVDALDKYKNHENCSLDISNLYGCSIAFLNNIGESVTSTHFFFQTESTIMMYARDFVLIPPRERKYWKKYQILDKDIVEK